jgi:type III secretory pathway component EscS
VKRLARVLLAWLLSIAVAFVVGICVGIVLAVISLPAIAAGIAAYSGGISPAFWLIVVVSAPILLGAGLVVGGFVGAQSSTFWTMTFRRLELDQATPAVSPSSS